MSERREREGEELRFRLKLRSATHRPSLNDEASRHYDLSSPSSCFAFAPCTQLLFLDLNNYPAPSCFPSRMTSCPTAARPVARRMRGTDTEKGPGSLFWAAVVLCLDTGWEGEREKESERRKEGEKETGMASSCDQPRRGASADSDSKRSSLVARRQHLNSHKLRMH